MRAHIITAGKVSNTIVVESLDVIPGLIDGENGGNIGDLWDGSVFTKPAQLPPTRDDLKEARQIAVDAIKVKVTSGKTFDGDETAQTRMARAIIGLQAAGVSVIEWTLANNESTAVTLTDLTEALILAGQEQARLWPLPA